MCFFQFICDAVDWNHQANVIFTSFLKAFDKLNHKLLSSQLETYGFFQNLLFGDFNDFFFALCSCRSTSRI